ncbi:MAG: glycosyltransferase family 2 protein [Paraglaciecola sp.]|nr:glycosyltransferase family 2 protein [Paraglaciecola sp.]
MFTVLTTTYNRVELLKRLYNSILEQNLDTEWVVVDDGSTDGTRDFFESIETSDSLAVKYIYQNNMGKHRALNQGIKYVSNDWVAIIDSDDFISPFTFKKVKHHIERLSLNKREDIAAIIFNSKFSDGSVVGTEFPFYEYMGKTYQYYDKYKIKGDKFDFYKLNVLKLFPFPEIPGEKFITEGIVWSRINDKYDSYFINEAYQVVEYLEGGLSNLSFLNRMKSPTGACLYYYEASLRNISNIKNFRNISNYFRFRFHGGNPKLTPLFSCVNKVYFFAFFLGFLLFLSDFINFQKKRLFK